MEFEGGKNYFSVCGEEEEVVVGQKGRNMRRT